MSWYEFLLFVHVTAAVVWLGGGLVTQLYAFRTLRSNDAGRIAAFAHDSEWLGLRLFAPASLTLFVAAILLMIEGSWDWGALWIVASLVVYAASFVTGIGFLGPESGRIGKLIQAEGAESPNALARIRRIFLFSRVELVLLLAVVYLMTVKPTTDDGWALLVLLACVGLALAAVAGAYLGSTRSRSRVTA